MSDEIYANHIIQKHRLAVAIAVIKNKPANQSIDSYVEQIRNKLNPSNVKDYDEAIVTSDYVCSEDFDDDYNLDTSSNEQLVDTNNFDTLLNENNVDTMNDNTNFIDKSNLNTVFCNNNVDNVSFSTDITKNINVDSLPIFVKNTTDKNTKDIDTSNFNTVFCHSQVYENSSFITDLTKNTNNFDITPNFDTNTNIEKNVNHKNTTDVFMKNTNLNQTVQNVHMNENSKKIKQDYLPDIENGMNENIIENDLESLNRTMTIDDDDNIDDGMNDSLNILEGLEDKENDPDAVDREVLDEVFCLIRNTDLNIEKEINSQRTYYESERNPSQNQLLESAENSTQKNIKNTIDSLNFTHYSQSQTQDIIIEPHFIKNNNNNNNIPRFQHDVAIRNNNSNELKNNDTRQNILVCTENRIENKCPSDDQHNQSQLLVACDEDQSTSNSVLPFKIIEEMNKIKSSLNKRSRRMSTDGQSTDSGYRSDSQKSVRNSLHLSQNWLNQSGCSLHKYLVDCPLTVPTQEITEEISQVLGNLIDSLHADEMYPTFLEEILDNIGKLLQDLYEEPNNCNDPLQKEECVQRIILLNKSYQTQKYTISKITNTLEKTYRNLTDSETIYEITNIDQTENLCYVFHLLAIIIKKYLKNEPISNQNASQTDLKRSSITEVWRKKWHPNKDSIDSIDNDNSCVLTNCREILNKLVVSCIEKYSLISYIALECFNLLQM